MIADRLGPMHMSANRTYEMQRTNHFEVVFEGISNDVTLCVDSAGALNTTIEPVELAYGNGKVKVAGQVLLRLKVKCHLFHRLPQQAQLYLQY